MDDTAQEAVPDTPEPQAATEGNTSAAAAEPETAGAEVGPAYGRRVAIVRTNGQYEIHMGQQVLQSFCSQFEAITRYALPEGCLQHCRINIEPVGQIREVADVDSYDVRGRLSEFAGARRPQTEEGDPPALAGAVRRATDLSDDSVEEMEIELPDRGEPAQERMQGLLRVAEQVTNFGRGPDRPPSWRDDLRAQLQRESTSLRMMLDFLERM